MMVAQSDSQQYSLTSCPWKQWSLSVSFVLLYLANASSSYGSEWTLMVLPAAYMYLVL